ncbi:PEP-CTERM sorting domain-containing protein [Oscillatoria sp. FACHB-1406]|uniref:PEP-CTERM sorting domain-containing protein n=1 Tax=Oscillatoria sp. FACHB-1406 TaxID=2692846 RepID=UPI00168823D5|nr:PEP-CTERM sorting domain-containing protein [Oscillatoria sp. FACHB-1406]MBD2577710.1 PEP-CTERM sorting domain-containing protein [Oscillatoria sp. FACHB-1406]
MKSQVLTGLLAATATVASVFTANASYAFNLKQSNPNLYNTFYSYVNGERNELTDAAQHKLDAGSLVATGDSFDIVFMTEGATYINDLFYSENGGALKLGMDNIASNDTALASFNSSYNSYNGHRELGEGLTYQTQKGNVLDFFLKSFQWWKGDGSDYNLKNLFGAEGAAGANTDGLQHLVAYDYFDGKDSWTLLGFEDIAGAKDPNNPWGTSDRDFNDAFFAIRGVTRGTTPPPATVPEPGVTLALVGIAGGYIASRRRQAAK